MKKAILLSVLVLLAGLYYLSGRDTRYNESVLEEAVKATTAHPIKKKGFEEIQVNVTLHTWDCAISQVVLEHEQNWIVLLSSVSSGGVGCTETRAILAQMNSDYGNDGLRFVHNRAIDFEEVAYGGTFERAIHPSAFWKEVIPLLVRNRVVVGVEQLKVNAAPPPNYALVR